MSYSYTSVTVFGGSGFIGRAIVRELARRDMVVRVASRTPQAAFEARTAGTPGQIVPVFYDPSDDASVRAALKGARFAVNCTGILFEKGGSRFDAVHRDLPARIASACAAEGVERLVHISALGIDRATSRYAASKRAGEDAARAAFPGVTILRPSVVFGPGDGFFNLFAGIAQISPALPLIGGGRTKFQPVYVGDVADAVAACLTIPSHVPASPLGRVYELGGPDVVDFRALLTRMFAATKQPRALVPLPWGLARIKAGILQCLPVPPLTMDQVESLKTDSVTAPGAPGLTALAITPTAMDGVLPSYLSRFQPGGRFGMKKRA